MSQIVNVKSSNSLRMRNNEVHNKTQLKGNNFNSSIYEKNRIQTKNKELFIVPWQMLRDKDY